MNDILLAAALIIVTGPGGQVIELNPQMVVTIRERTNERGFVPGVKCLIHTVDGKVIQVVEDCAVVRQKMEDR